MRLKDGVVQTFHESLDRFWFACDAMEDSDEWTWLFTDNETNAKRHPGLPSESEYFKDAFNNYVVVGTPARSIRISGAPSAPPTVC